MRVKSILLTLGAYIHTSNYLGVSFAHSYNRKCLFNVLYVLCALTVARLHTSEQ